MLANRRHGPEQVMSIVAQRAPHGFAHIDDVIAPDELRAIVASYSAGRAASTSTSSTRGRRWRRRAIAR